VLDDPPDVDADWEMTEHVFSLMREDDANADGRAGTGHPNVGDGAGNHAGEHASEACYDDEDGHASARKSAQTDLQEVLAHIVATSTFESTAAAAAAARDGGGGGSGVDAAAALGGLKMDPEASSLLQMFYLASRTYISLP
jgi:hypothetical protein